MAFFCPTMAFAEELPIQSPDQHPLVDKATADLCLHRAYPQAFLVFNNLLFDYISQQLGSQIIRLF